MLELKHIGMAFKNDGPREFRPAGCRKKTSTVIKYYNVLLKESWGTIRFEFAGRLQTADRCDIEQMSRDSIWAFAHEFGGTEIGEERPCTESIINGFRDAGWKTIWEWEELYPTRRLKPQTHQEQLLELEEEQLPDFFEEELIEFNQEETHKIGEEPTTKNPQEQLPEFK